MDCFFAPDIDNLFLPPAESFHCIKALRHSSGDEILITNGLGRLYTATITKSNSNKCEFVIKNELQTSSYKSIRSTHVAFAPTKQVERIEWMIEKLTEIGINEFTPLLCHFSQRKNLRIDRLTNVMIAACKQSINPFFPKINPMADFNFFVSTCRAEKKFIAHCYPLAKPDLLSELKKCPNSRSSFVCLIGPEGDFSEEEVSFAQNNGFLAVSLGAKRLRTETAAMVAGHLMSLYE